MLIPMLDMSRKLRTRIGSQRRTRRVTMLRTVVRMKRTFRLLKALTKDAFTVTP
jgi:hypothetical protein